MQIDMKFNELGQKLLDKYHSKEMTTEEFDTEIAYMMLAGGIDHMRFRKNPPTPAVVTEYHRKKEATPTYVVSQEFWQQPDVKHWGEATSHNFCENRGNWHWLKFLKRVVPGGDYKSREVIKGVMETYNVGSRRLQEMV